MKKFFEIKNKPSDFLNVIENGKKKKVPFDSVLDELRLFSDFEKIRLLMLII